MSCHKAALALPCPALPCPALPCLGPAFATGEVVELHFAFSFAGLSGSRRTRTNAAAPTAHHEEQNPDRQHVCCDAV